jgi:hypothetical protein
MIDSAISRARGAVWTPRPRDDIADTPRERDLAESII